MDALLGISTEGTNTLGAEYARAHPDDMPDEVVGTEGKVVVIRLNRYVVGRRYRIQGISGTVLAGTPGVGLVIDTRGYTAESVDAVLPPGRLLFWHGYYWRVANVHGVNVVLTLHGKGTSRKVKGWRITMKGATDFVTKV